MEGDSFPRLVEVIRRLREPDGCPWDREQTLEDLGRYILEEAREVVDAIHAGDRRAVAEELGDVLFNLVHAARIAEEEGSFTLAEVIEGACEKVVRRHPHVFGDAKAETTEEVLRHWNRVKEEEKRSRAADNPPSGSEPAGR